MRKLSINYLVTLNLYWPRNSTIGMCSMLLFKSQHKIRSLFFKRIYLLFVFIPLIISIMSRQHIACLMYEKLMFLFTFFLFTAITMLLFVVLLLIIRHKQRNNNKKVIWIEWVEVQVEVNAWWDLVCVCKCAMM